MNAQEKLIKLAYLVERLRHAEDLYELHGTQESYMHLPDIRRRVDAMIDEILRGSGHRIDDDSDLAPTAEIGGRA